MLVIAQLVVGVERISNRLRKGLGARGPDVSDCYYPDDVRGLKTTAADADEVLGECTGGRARSR